MIGFRNFQIAATSCFLSVVIFYSGCATQPASRPTEVPAPAEASSVQHARQLLNHAGLAEQVECFIDPSLNDPEAFNIKSSHGITHVIGGGPGGVLYGAQELILRLKAEPAAAPNFSQRPDFKLRGSVLFLMKDCSYDWELSPKEFPWFYDRTLLTRYFDYLCENRFNTIFLWSGHLFPSLVDLPEYPNASDLSREQLLQNQEQFKWFTDECAKRNISVLLHFYNIHYTHALAKAYNLPILKNPVRCATDKPTEFLAKYYRYTLERFLREFKSVGLYVCPGETLTAQYQPEWIRDVIIAAARAAGTEPTIVVRAWCLDELKFKAVCGGQYEQLYTEGKHNIEKLVSPVPDPRNRLWKELTGKHIVNLHETADIKPLRWGSPKFIHEMVEEWEKAGMDGAEVYGQVSWRWPYTLDKLSPDQKTFWPDGPKLLTIDRDAIWLEAYGRYLWKVERDPAEEETYWTDRLAEKFGSSAAGDLIRRWYETTGPILPGLQNIVDVDCYNGYPTVAGNIPIRDILRLRTYRQQYWPVPHPYRPVDNLFYERYRTKFKIFQPERIGMTVREYAETLAEGNPTFGMIGQQDIQAILNRQISPPQVFELMFELIGEADQLARQARAAATRNQEEIDPFIQDTQILKLITQTYQHKVMAAVSLFLWEKRGDEKDKQATLDQLQGALRVTRELVELTDRLYINATDISMDEVHNWRGAMKTLEQDQQKIMETLNGNITLIKGKSSK